MFQAKRLSYALCALAISGALITFSPASLAEDNPNGSGNSVSPEVKNAVIQEIDRNAESTIVAPPPIQPGSLEERAKTIFKEVEDDTTLKNDDNGEIFGDQIKDPTSITNEDDGFEYIDSDPKLYAELRRLYREGDVKNSVKLLTQLAEGGDVYCSYVLGYCYHTGNHIGIKNLELAKHFYEISDRYGNPNAAYNLGLIYDSEDGVHTNCRKAVDYYKRAADQGLSEACLNLALHLHSGLGVAQNDEEAFVVMKKGAEQNSKECLNGLGFAYSRGVGTKQNLTEGFQCYKKSADMGFDIAQVNTAICYVLGRGVNVDLENGLLYFNKAADADNIYALNLLGMLYLGHANVKRDYEKAYNYFARAATLHSSAAYRHLGSLYFSGLGVPKDYNMAFKLFAKAAEAGSGVAKRYLGSCFYSGLGTDVDYGAAVKCFEEAVNKYHIPYAAHNLGVCYLYGHGVKQDFETAKHYFKMASEQGVPFSEANLAAIYYNGLGTDARKPQKCHYWLDKGIEQNSPRCQMLKGLCYDTGFGVEKDTVKARELYLESLKLLRLDSTLIALALNYEKSPQNKQFKKEAQALRAEVAEKNPVMSQYVDVHQIMATFCSIVETPYSHKEMDVVKDQPVLPGGDIRQMNINNEEKVQESQE